MSEIDSTPQLKEREWLEEITGSLSRSIVAVNALMHWHTRTDNGVATYSVIPFSVWGEPAPRYGHLDTATPAELDRLSGGWWQISMLLRNEETKTQLFSQVCLNRLGGVAASLEMPLSSRGIAHSYQKYVATVIASRLQEQEPLTPDDYRRVTETVLNLDTMTKTATQYWNIVRYDGLDEARLESSAMWAFNNDIV